MLPAGDTRVPGSFMSARLAVCLTPDANFFRPAVLTAASILAQADSDALDVLLLCEEADVAPGFDTLDPALRARIDLRIVDWSRYVAGLPVRGHFTSAVNRRLALHRVLPDAIDRYVSLDADMLAVCGRGSPRSPTSGWATRPSRLWST